MDELDKTKITTKHQNQFMFTIQFIKIVLKYKTSFSFKLFWNSKSKTI